MTYPPDSDIILKSQHGGQHCLFFDPAVPVADIAKQTTLAELCDWANREIKTHGSKNFTADPARHYDAANLVKINQMVSSVAQRGSVKPFLLHYHGHRPFTTGTGDTRLRAIERLPEISHVSAIISTHCRYWEHFSHLREIKDLSGFATCFGVAQAQFLIRLTDADAAYGIDWYEYVLDDPAVAVPDWDFCISALQHYIDHQTPDFQFDPDWFDQPVDWSQYVKL